MSTGRFRCTVCGDRFDIDAEENELYSEGLYACEPDICDDCLMHSSYIHYDEYSDADPGL